MLTVVNARGVPGAAGAVARDRDGKRYLVTCHHVLFGAGAGASDVVFALAEHGGERTLMPVARAAHGYQGRVDDHDGAVTFIDCAFAELDDTADWPQWLNEAVTQLADIDGVARGLAGASVTKHGWLTGRTRGVIADAEHFDRPTFNGQIQDTPRQLLIRPANVEERFSASGESGAAVLDDGDRIVGFLWGCTTYGEGIAFPAAAALERFGMSVECRPRPLARSHG